MVSSLTHAHDRSCMACGIYAFVFEEVLKVQNKSSVWIGLKKAEKYYEHNSEFSAFERLFSADFASLPKEEIKSSGYVVDTLEAAIWCVLNSSNYKETMLQAVNLGGDTDTIAAVAGGLAGVFYGYSTLPKEWLNEVADKDSILSLCDDFEKTRSRMIQEENGRFCSDNAALVALSRVERAFEGATAETGFSSEEEMQEYMKGIRKEVRGY